MNGKQLVIIRWLQNEAYPGAPINSEYIRFGRKVCESKITVRGSNEGVKQTNFPWILRRLLDRGGVVDVRELRLSNVIVGDWKILPDGERCREDDSNVEDRYVDARTVRVVDSRRYREYVFDAKWANRREAKLKTPAFDMARAGFCENYEHVPTASAISEQSERTITVGCLTDTWLLASYPVLPSLSCLFDSILLSDTD